MLSSLNTTHSHNTNHTHYIALQELGAAVLSKRPTSCMLVLAKPPKPAAAGADAAEAAEFDEAYNEVVKKVKAGAVVFH